MGKTVENHVARLKARQAYCRAWFAARPGYRNAYARRRAMARGSKRAVCREILGVRVRVNEFSAFINGREKEKS